MHLKSDDYKSLGARPKVIPVVSTKGGEGKSTQAANLGGFLADAGIKTLIIDGDHAQPTASSIYPLAYEAPCGLYELLMQTADLSRPENIISRTEIDNLDVIVSNDPRNLLPTYMLNVADGRVRLRNALANPVFSQYDVILIDSQGSRSVMSELIILAATGEMIGMVKPVLPDIRHNIPVEKVRSRQITLNHDGGLWLRYGQGQMPVILQQGENGWQLAAF